MGAEARVGFDSIEAQSVSSVRGKSRISKRGREVRKCLSEATLPVSSSNPCIRATYRRLKETGKPDKMGNRRYSM